MRYIPHTEDDIRQMLKTIGVRSVEDLFRGVPDGVRLNRPLELPAPLSESEVIAELENLASQNVTASNCISFLGGGAYNHFIPSVVDYLASRSEFSTAYTPYQPEISQGTLQAIFEYQTLICQLTGMEVANASLYDGASACAEAVMMAVRATRRHRVLLSAALHPEYRETVRTYCRHLEVEFEEVPFSKAGGTSFDALKAMADDQTAAMVTGYPNVFGVVERLEESARLIHAQGGRLVCAVQEPISLGLLKSPGELGADIVVGEGQSFGIPVSFGGPYLGFFAARQKDVRSMPGRLVGATEDLRGRRGYVLTLATREQHIRREKATSNICSNQGLCALMAVIYLSLMGRQGLRDVARQNLSKAEYAKKQILALSGCTLPFDSPTFNEFVIESKEPAEGVLKRLEAQGILGGIAMTRFYPEMTHRILVCVTEQNSREQIDALAAALKGGGV